MNLKEINTNLLVMKNIKLILVVTCVLIQFLLEGCTFLSGKNIVISNEKVLSDVSKIFKNTRFYKAEFLGELKLWKLYYIGEKGEPRLVYYDPIRHYLFFGELWSINGTSLTGEDIAREEAQFNKLKVGNSK